MTNKKIDVAIIIVAAGSGTRFASANPLPKQYQLIGKQPLLAKSLDAFLQCPEVDAVLPIINFEQRDIFDQHIQAHPKLLPPVAGGASRQQSVFAGLKHLADIKPKIVLIHDAARPFVQPELIREVISVAQQYGGALPALPVTDTLKHAPVQEFVSDTIDRTTHFIAQTPQGFAFEKLFAAHQKAAQTSPEKFTDDSSIAEWAGMKVKLVPGNPANKKITFSHDLKEANAQMSPVEFETRIGNGFDVHAFEPGDKIILGGIEIAHNQKLKGHSDADVGLHTITDALYGAIADGDIGQHFPPSDAEWKDMDSAHFLRHACGQIEKLGGKIINIDLTLICEQPKIGPHCHKMRQNIAHICDVDISRISVKATTTERLGFTGRGEGIAAQASVSVKVPV